MGVVQPRRRRRARGQDNPKAGARSSGSSGQSAKCSTGPPWSTWRGAWPARRCTTGCAPTRCTGWRDWWTAVRSPRAARTRCHRWWKPEWWSCGGPTPAGGRARSCTVWLATASSRCRGAPRCTHPGPPRAHRPDQASPSPLRLQALGARPVDGAVADGCCRAHPPGRRHRALGGHGHRRPHEVLRVRTIGGSRDGAASVRRPGPGGRGDRRSCSTSLCHRIRRAASSCASTTTSCPSRSSSQRRLRRWSSFASS